MGAELREVILVGSEQTERIGPGIRTRIWIPYRTWFSRGDQTLRSLPLCEAHLDWSSKAPCIMDIPVSDSLFQDDDFTRVEVQLEPRQVSLLKALASRKEISFDQTLRYLLNVAIRHVSPTQDGPEDDADDADDEASVFDQFRSIAHRIEQLQEKSESTETREMQDVLEQMLNQYQKAKAERSTRSSAPHPPEENINESESDPPGPPSMFEIANQIDMDDQE